MICTFVLMMSVGVIGAKLPDRSEVIEQAQANQSNNVPLVLNNNEMENKIAYNIQWLQILKRFSIKIIFIKGGILNARK